MQAIFPGARSSDFAQKSFHLRCHRLLILHFRVYSDHYHLCRRPQPFIVPQELPDNPLEPVSANGIAGIARYRDSEFGPPGNGWRACDFAPFPFVPFGFFTSQNCQKVVSSPQSRYLAERSIGFQESGGQNGSFVGNRKPLSAFGATVFKHDAARPGRHSLAEAVIVLSLAVRRLKRSFHAILLDKLNVKPNRLAI